jgi:hypothetical protein
MMVIWNARQRRVCIGVDPARELREQNVFERVHRSLEQTALYMAIAHGSKHASARLHKDGDWKESLA